MHESDQTNWKEVAGNISNFDYFMSLPEESRAEWKQIPKAIAEKKCYSEIDLLFWEFLHNRIGMGMRTTDEEAARLLLKIYEFIKENHQLRERLDRAVDMIKDMQLEYMKLGIPVCSLRR